MPNFHVYDLATQSEILKTTALAFPAKHRISGTITVWGIKSYFLTESTGELCAESSVRSPNLRHSGSKLELTFVFSQ